MIRIAVCEDDTALNKLIQKKTCSYINDQLHIECACSGFNSAADILSAASKIKFDVIEMDVELDHHNNGITIAQKINQISPDTQVIFVTGHKEYYLDVYDAKHVFFVEKDKMDRMLPKALQKALDFITEECNESTISLKCKGEWTVVNKKNIIYIEKNLRQAKFFMENGKNIQVYMNTSDIMHLLQSADFIQVHRSFIINMRHVVRLYRDVIMMSNDKAIPVGSTFMKDFQDQFLSSHQHNNSVGK